MFAGKWAKCGLIVKNVQRYSLAAISLGRLLPGNSNCVRPESLRRMVAPACPRGCPEADFLTYSIRVYGFNGGISSRPRPIIALGICPLFRNGGQRKPQAPAPVPQQFLWWFPGLAGHSSARLRSMEAVLCRDALGNLLAPLPLTDFRKQP